MVQRGPPKQAVILAGGRGTRLLPLTLDAPKPMILFGGRPFLAHLIEMLVEHGIQRVVLLVGYLSGVIRAYFGDGHSFGIEIVYSEGPIEDETGTRLLRAKPLLDDQFLLLYCDNYWPMQLERLWANYLAGGCAAQVTVYANNDGYTRNNLRVGHGVVEVYDKSRSAIDLSGVDIGFLLLRKDVLDLIEGDNPSFERCVYPKLVAAKQLGAFVTEHRYYSVGSHERLSSTEAFFARRPTIFLDRDGTLNRRPPPAEYVRSWSEWEWLPGVLSALKLLTDAGYRIIIVTNQPGIARGMLSLKGLEEIHRRMIDEAKTAGAVIDDVFFCPHGWNDGCSCRKPAPGMLYQAQRKHTLDLSRAILIGDDERDGLAAAAAGCRHWILEKAPPVALLPAVQMLLAGELQLSR